MFYDIESSTMQRFSTERKPGISPNELKTFLSLRDVITNENIIERLTTKTKVLFE